MLYENYTATFESGLKISHQLVCISVTLCPLLSFPTAPFAPL